MKVKKLNSNLIATNKKARQNYQFLETFEAGLVLSGAEIKSVRARRVSISDSYAKILGGELWLVNSHIAQYDKDSSQDYDPRRSRKLLVKKSELAHLAGKLQKGLTLIPTKIYLKKGIAKVQLALARGKKLWDKRKALKERDLARQSQQELKATNL